MRNREKRILRNLWSSFYYITSSLEWGNLGDRLLAITRTESKNHNRGRPDRVPHCMTIEQEARFFALKRVVEYITGHKPPRPEDYIHFQTSCFFAYSLVKTHPDNLNEWYAENEADCLELLLWDYATMVKGKDRPYDENFERVELVPAATGSAKWLVEWTKYGKREIAKSENIQALNSVVARVMA